MAFDSPALLPPLLHVPLPVMAFGFKQWKPDPCCKSYLSEHCSIPYTTLAAPSLQSVAGQPSELLSGPMQ